MEQGFIKANSANLPRIDLLMLGGFFASNNDFCSAEFRNVKTAISSRPSYGDDAVSYVQLKRDGKMCTVKGKICPEHKVHSKLYNVTLVVDEEEVVTYIQCDDCVASRGGCKHSIVFLMWIYRRSEEPTCTVVTCYWKKSKLSKVGTSLSGSPDGICEKSIIEIKCPTSTKAYKNYISKCKPTDKFNTQMQMQMFLTGLKKGFSV